MRKSIAIYEIIGGIAAIIAFIQLIKIIIAASAYTQIHVSWSFIVFTIIIPAFLVCIIQLIAGIFLYKNNKLGYRLSLVVQFMQIIMIQTTQFHYHFYSPAGLGIYFDMERLRFFRGIGSSFIFSLKHVPTNFTYVGINFLAFIVFFLLLITRLMRKQTIEK